MQAQTQKRKIRRRSVTIGGGSQTQEIKQEQPQKTKAKMAGDVAYHYVQEVEQLIEAERQLKILKDKLKSDAKQYEDIIKKNSALLLDEGRETKTKKFFGKDELRYAEIKASKSNEVDPIGLVKYLVKTKQLTLIPQLLKAQVTNALKFIGELRLKEAGCYEQKIDEYGRVTTES